MKRNTRKKMLWSFGTAALVLADVPFMPFLHSFTKFLGAAPTRPRICLDICSPNFATRRSSEVCSTARPQGPSSRQNWVLVVSGAGRDNRLGKWLELRLSDSWFRRSLDNDPHGLETSKWRHNTSITGADEGEKGNNPGHIVYISYIHYIYIYNYIQIRIYIYFWGLLKWLFRDSGHYYNKLQSTVG